MRTMMVLRRSCSCFVAGAGEGADSARALPAPYREGEVCLSTAILRQLIFNKSFPAWIRVTWMDEMLCKPERRPGEGGRTRTCHHVLTFICTCRDVV